MKTNRILIFSCLIVIALLVSGCTISIGGNSKKVVDGGVYKSIDGSATWNQVAVVPTANGKVASISNVDIRRMIFDPSDYNTIYLSTETDGVVYTNNGGDNWNQFKQFVGQKIRSIGVDAKDKCNLYVLSANKLYKSTDCGRFWTDVYVHQNADVILTDVLVDYFNSSIIYMTTSVGEVLKSTDSGMAWATVNRVDRGVFLDLAIDPKNSRIVYAATEKHGVYKTIDGGATWESLGIGLKAYAGSQEYRSLIIDQSAKNSLILISKFGMLRTQDGGTTWEVIELLPASKKTTIYSAAINPRDSQEIYYATRTTLVKSTDGGKTWSSQDLPTTRSANKIIINPTNPDIVYLGAMNASN
ncbi:hypothetical protein GW933_01275 [Candidatus Falkowbacteria bacterium]|uniref:Uncharacterized protein n=1 Tax=Candidatus Buchananbacteria bacterium CG10_big_fil_rev_8_21_14_0_10_33_19 TaxID=1974525 RepID=A0A2H0W3D9_9BACT|nr:hypothetical protein [Candidatus Falkowbacteria bacterium]PIS05885.1 MAG: hypothetical protein COT80_03905 [Candidatus Buchananbacteria bacterium CG10_big_fil_rev_8_21_14_0_10_33_19]